MLDDLWWFKLMRSRKKCSEIMVRDFLFHGSDAHEPLLGGLRTGGRLTLSPLLVPRLSCWPRAHCAVNRHGSATSQSSARASPPSAPPTSTRWTAPLARTAKPTATMACASPTRSSASSCGALVRRSPGGGSPSFHPAAS